MRFFTDAELALHVSRCCQEAVTKALEDVDTASSERAQFLEEQHGWEVKRLTARAEDAESASLRFKTGYKRALKKIRTMSVELETVKGQLQKAGLTTETDDKGRPKVTPAQEIMDELDSLVPGLDDLSRDKVKSYVDRELRKRGEGEKDSILQEVITGGYQD